MKQLILSLLVIIIFNTSSFSQRVETLVKGPSSFDDGLAVDYLGNIYASRYFGSTVTKITPSGETTIFSSGFNSPNAIAFDNEGNLIVPSATGNRVHRVAKDGSKEVIVNNIQNPTGIAVDSVGNIYISQYSLSKISKLDTTGTLTTFLSGGLLNGPVTMIFDNEGDLFIGNYNDGKILKYTPDSNLVVIGDIPGWLGSFTLVDSTIYASAFQRNLIYKIPKDGSSQEVFAGKGTKGSKDGALLEATFNVPNGITGSPSGDTLYISDFETRSLRMITGLIPGNPKLSAPDSVFFGEVNLDLDKLFIEKIPLENKGNDTLHITSIFFPDSVFQTPVDEIFIEPYSVDTLVLEFLPEKVGEVSSVITLHSNSGTGEKDIVISVEVVSNTSSSSISEIPNRITLSQNYPNPFNPGSTIQFSLAKISKVRLEVFNLMGQKVATLLNGEQKEAGQHNVYFEADYLPSGIYIYKLQAGGFIETKKMMLIK